MKIWGLSVVWCLVSIGIGEPVWFIYCVIQYVVMAHPYSQAGLVGTAYVCSFISRDFVWKIYNQKEYFRHNPMGIKWLCLLVIVNHCL